MATNVATLTAKLLADTSDLEAGFNRAESKANGMGSKVGSAMKGIGVAAVAGAAVAGAAIAGVAVKGVTEFAAFEKGMNEVFTLLPGMSEDAMSQMEDDVLALSNRMGVLPEETIPALYQSLSAGVPQDNVFAFMETANELAIGGVAELDESVGALTGVMNAYTDGSVSASEAADMMFTTVKNGVTTIPELSASLGDVTPIAASLGIGFDEVSAAMATSTKVTQNTAKSATGLKSMLAELGKGGTAAFKVFEEASGQTFPDFIASGGDLAGAMQIMQQHGDETGTTMLDMFGSIEAGQEALRLAADGSSELITQMDNMTNSVGASGEAFDTMDTGLARSWDKIKTTMTTALIKIGKKLAPFVEKAAAWLGEKLPGAIDWLIEAFEKMWPTIQKVARWLGETIPKVIKVLVAYWEWLGPKIAAVFEVVSGVISTFVSWFSGDGSAQVNDTVSKWQGYFQDFIDFVKPIWDGIVETITTAVELISTVVTLVWEGITALWETHGERILNTVTRVFGAIRDYIQGVMGIIQGIIDVVMGIITGDWERVWEGIKKFVSGIWDAIKALISLAWEAVQLAIALGLDALQVAWEFVWNAIATFVSNIWDNIKEAIGLAVDWVKDTLQDRWDTIKATVEEIWNAISGFFTTIWDTIKLGIETAVNWVRDTLAGVWDTISTKVSDIWNAIWTTISGIWDTIKTGVATAIENVKIILGNWWDTISTKVSDIWQGILTFITDRWEDIKTGVSSAISWVRDTLAGIWDAIYTKVQDTWNSIVQFVRDRVDDIVGAINSIPAIPIGGVTWEGPGAGSVVPSPSPSNPGEIAVTNSKAVDGGFSGLAVGGIVTSPTMALLAEAGEPEAVIPLSKAHSYGFGGGGSGVTVVVNGNLFGAATTDELVEILEDARRQYRLRGGAMV
jgi:TP901 family phage tail tape measure protein